jgi:poly(A) polymerase
LPVPDPVIVPRADHVISRRNIDPDALKVLYRLREHGHIAYLVGGSVRDLLLGRRPKDFDIGTDAHPYQIKKLFRNCWIIGRRFRLAHIKFGPKTIEVATFRRNLTEAAADATPDEAAPVVASAPAEAPAASGREGARGVIHRDNTFGTPEEDAFRRDFTINGLFYDIATYSVIDYVGGLQDLEARVVRSIGDPRVRFVEDPVRMLRAAVMSARLGFDLDPLVVAAIAEHRQLIKEASPARLLEEYYKILRSGAAEATFRALGRERLLELMTPELAQPADAVWDALARLDRYRQRFAAAPPELTNAVLIGALIEPLGLLKRPATAAAAGRAPHGDRMSFGMLPVARRDVDRLTHVLQVAPRMLEPALPPRVVRSLAHRPAFPDALTWLEIHAEAPEAVASWRHVRTHDTTPAADEAASTAEAVDGAPGRRRRRRRRRRRGRRGGGGRPSER